MTTVVMQDGDGFRVDINGVERGRFSNGAYAAAHVGMLIIELDRIRDEVDKLAGKMHGMTPEQLRKMTVDDMRDLSKDLRDAVSP